MSTTLACTSLLGDCKLIIVAGDTLTYTLGAMKPETASASVVTADATAKQLALNKVSSHYRLRMSCFGNGYGIDLFLIDRSLSRQYHSIHALLIAK